MGQPVISELNYDAVLATEDYTSQQQVIENEIVTRFKLGSGFPYQTAEFGIVDAANPSLVTSTEVSRPLFVGVSTLNALTVSVNAGYAIAPNGSILNVASFQQTVALASPPVTGAVYVVIAQAAINNTAGTTQLNDYQELLSSQVLVYTQVTSVLYTTGWTPATNQVPLAVVTVSASGLSQVISIDQTQNTYAFNRPWFSTVDTYLRSSVGTGTKTSTNVLGLSWNDLTAPGTVDIFQGLTGQGAIVSQATLRNKMVGALICNDAITYAFIQTDDSLGSVTAGSPYGGAYAQYCYLTKFPTRLGSVCDSTTPAYAISGEVIPNTNILVFGPEETFSAGQTVNVQYTSTTALLPPSTITSNTLDFGQPSTGEVIVAGTYLYPTVSNTTLSMEGTGPFARRYYVSLLPTGVLQVAPQILVPAQSALTSITGSFTPTYPARISVGLTNTTGSSSLSVVVTITGTVTPEIGTTPGNVTETLTFSPSTGFADQVVPSTNYDLAGQLLFTANRFSEVTSIGLTVANAGTNPQIQFWAELEPGTVPEMNGNAQIATIFWNGGAVQAIQDARVIRPVWTEQASYMAVAGEAELDSILMLNATKNAVTALTNTSVKLFTEDFEDTRYLDSAWGFLAPTSGTGTIGLSNTAALVVGDTVTLTGSMTLTAINGTPSLPSQFNVGPLSPAIGAIAVAANLAAAINSFASPAPVTATISPTNSLNIDLVLNTPTGVSANSVAISAVTANSGAVTALGFTSAYDGYGECYLDRNVVGLVSPVIPSNSVLNPYQYTYRRRYRSRAVALSSAIGTQSHFMIEVHGQNKSFTDSVRIRGAFASSPTLWQAWQLATAVPNGNKGLYQITFGAPVHKIQVEYYGRARGLSVYMTRP